MAAAAETNQPTAPSPTRRRQTSTVVAVTRTESMHTWYTWPSQPTQYCSAHCSPAQNVPSAAAAAVVSAASSSTRQALCTAANCQGMASRSRPVTRQHAQVQHALVSEHAQSARAGTQARLVRVRVRVRVPACCNADFEADTTIAIAMHVCWRTHVRTYIVLSAMRDHHHQHRRADNHDHEYEHEHGELTHFASVKVGSRVYSCSTVWMFGSHQTLWPAVHSGDRHT